MGIKKTYKKIVKNNQNKVNVFVIMIFIFTWTCSSFESFSACRPNLISKIELKAISRKMQFEF